jgi:hypothetical protein
MLTVFVAAEGFVNRTAEWRNIVIGQEPLVVQRDRNGRKGLIESEE